VGAMSGRGEATATSVGAPLCRNAGLSGRIEERGGWDERCQVARCGVRRATLLYFWEEVGLFG